MLNGQTNYRNLASADHNWSTIYIFIAKLELLRKTSTSLLLVMTLASYIRVAFKKINRFCCAHAVKTVNQNMLSRIFWIHCVKSVRIQSHSGPYFPAFRLIVTTSFGPLFKFLFSSDKRLKAKSEDRHI